MFPNGDQYEGFFVDGKMEGKGVLINSKGEQYIG
jgi:hypothetical protein